MAQIFFGKNLKYIKDCLKETQQGMSDRLLLPLKQYQSYESNGIETSYKKLVQISDLTGIDIDTLLREDLRKKVTEMDMLRMLSKPKVNLYSTEDKEPDA